MPRKAKFRLSMPSKKGAKVSEGPPLLCCVVCYNEFTSYRLSCYSWEKAVTKDFYAALNIPMENGDVDSVVSLPFCPECHSKVCVMFSVHQQLQNILQNFNSIRNDIAFTVVETIDKNCKKGPLDLIRQKIHARWKPLHVKAKNEQSINVFDPENVEEFLKPKLSILDEWPLDSKSAAVAEISKRHAKELERLKHKSAADISDEVTAGGTNKKNATMDMPKLELMAKLPLPPLTPAPSSVPGQSTYSKEAALKRYCNTRLKNSRNSHKLPRAKQSPKKLKKLRWYNCRVCGKEYYTSQSLAGHMNLHKKSLSWKFTLNKGKSKSKEKAPQQVNGDASAVE